VIYAPIRGLHSSADDPCTSSLAWASLLSSQDNMASLGRQSEAEKCKAELALQPQALSSDGSTSIFHSWISIHFVYVYVQC